MSYRIRKSADAWFTADNNPEDTQNTERDVIPEDASTDNSMQVELIENDVSPEIIDKKEHVINSLKKLAENSKGYARDLILAAIDKIQKEGK